MNVLDLFSGIGGFSLGLERADSRYKTVAFCEIDPYCRAVIAKHWPGVPIFGDICQLTAETLADPGLRRCGGKNGGEVEQQGRTETVGTSVDVICGGFPCQDISVAGKGAGLAGARSGLWREYHRLIRELRPRYVIVENVAALLSRGLSEVLGDLAALGYDAEWHCIPAAYVGAPHRRDRIWIVAYPSNNGAGWREQFTQCGESSGDVADAKHSGRSWRDTERRWTEATMSCGWWESEPDVGRVAHGVPARVDRLRALGNAVVPQVVELIGHAIMEAERVRQIR